MPERSAFPSCFTYEIRAWLGAESNRRHVDFQSTALPTELPSRDGADRTAPWGFHYAAMSLQGKRPARRRPSRRVTRSLEDSLIVGLRFPVTIGPMKKPIFTSEAPAAIGPYSQGMRSGRFLFCSGQIPLDPKSGEIVRGDIATQTRRVMDNIAGLLRTEGLTFDHIVKTTIFLTNLGDFQTVNEVYGSYFKQDPPARSTVQVSALPRGANVEIEVIAMADDGGQPAYDTSG